MFLLFVGQISLRHKRELVKVHIYIKIRRSVLFYSHGILHIIPRYTCILRSYKHVTIQQFFSIVKENYKEANQIKKTYHISQPDT